MKTVSNQYHDFRETFEKTFVATSEKSSDKDSVSMTWFESPVGPLIAGAIDEGVCFLEFSDRQRIEHQALILKKRFKNTVLTIEHRWLKQLQTELDQYFQRNRKSFDVSLVYPGTNFEVNVWSALLKIPYGETCSYDQLAKAIGHPDAQRAVGRANGLNPIAIVIPCHRVINKNGKLGGYGGGLWRKQKLLELEHGEIRLFD